VIETAFQGVVTRFGVRQRDAPQLFFFGIVIEVHVLAAQHAPIEPTVLDLVLTEVAELGRERRGESDRQGDGADESSHR